MQFSTDTHYFITKRGNDIILYNRFSKVYERWILNKGSNVTDKISIDQNKDGITFNLNNYIHKLELQVVPPRIIKLEEKDVSAQGYGGWAENSGSASFFEADPVPDTIEEVNSKLRCACSKVEIEADLQEYEPPSVDKFAKSYVLCRVEEHVSAIIDNFAKSYVLCKVELHEPPKIDNFAKSYVLGRLKKFIPPVTDNFAKTYTLGRLKIHIPPRVDNFAKSYTLGRLKIHHPPRVDNFARSYMLGRMKKRSKDKFSTFFWKIVFICDVETPLGEACVLHFRNDLPSFFYPAISKDKYIVFEDKNEILDVLFTIPGINKVGSESYKIYIEKSDNYFWEEIITNMIKKLTVFFKCYESSEMPGSRYVSSDSAIRKHFNKNIPHRNIINKIVTGSPVSYDADPVTVPSKVDREGQKIVYEPFASRYKNARNTISKPYVYKFNEYTKRWYKEQVDSVAGD